MTPSRGYFSFLTLVLIGGDVKTHALAVLPTGKRRAIHKVGGEANRRSSLDDLGKKIFFTCRELKRGLPNPKPSHNVRQVIK